MIHAELCGFVQQLGLVGKHNGHRYLLFFGGEPSWGETQLGSLGLGNEECLLLADKAIAGLSPKCAKQHLGREFSAVIIDAYSVQSVDEWLAAAGTVLAGGLLIFLCPEFDQWPRYFLSKSDAAQDAAESFFLKRILSKVADRLGVYEFSQRSLASSAFRSQLPALLQPWQPSLPTPDQRAAVDAIIRVVSGRAKRPLVIRSDRGRGKTSSLGIAVADLFQNRLCLRVAITAPNVGAVEAAFRQVQLLLPDGELSEDAFHFHDCELIFLPATELGATAHWDLVLVDEAATLPVGILHELLQTQPRIVFSTTVHGYEGSGRGFDTRFKDILDRERPQWRRVELREPVRWAGDDPLERWLYEAFLLRAEVSTPRDSSPVQLRVLKRDDFLQEAILSQVFGLLVQAHYQTSPRDLQYLLDSSCVVIVAESDDGVIGVCQLLPEGGLSDDLSAAVVSGQRRPRGHLVAQRLAHINAEAVYARCVSFRVNRIAVVAELRRQGIAGSLLAAAEEHSRRMGGAYLSSSFAASAEVVQFWLRNDFLPLWLGSRRDTSSGAYSLIVAKALQSSVDMNFNQMQQRLLDDLPLTVRHVHSKICADTLVQILVSGSRHNEMSTVDLRQMQRYCNAELIFEQVAASLMRICCGVDLRAISGAELAVSVLLFSESWASVAAKYQLSGRAAVEQKLRNIFNEIGAIYEFTEAQ
ncbi:GNAT family N-acetyltransferase [Zhongshania sp.]|jgi:tRNA(Met) cytidine acetyltransferase|uniref:GNAT family N-acetyltransferase n=1 Tax=Zhongshania sp. TaxID=1971902 RepID=UPI0039E3317D